MTAELQGGVWRNSDKVGQLDGAEAAARAKSRGRDVGKQDRVHLCGCAPERSAGKWSS